MVSPNQVWDWLWHICCIFMVLCLSYPLPLSRMNDRGGAWLWIRNEGRTHPKKNFLCIMYRFWDNYGQLWRIVSKFISASHFTFFGVISPPPPPARAGVQGCGGGVQPGQPCCVAEYSCGEIRLRHILCMVLPLPWVGIISTPITSVTYLPKKYTSATFGLIFLS